MDRNHVLGAVVDVLASRSPQGDHGMFLFLTVQGGFVHADIRFNFIAIFNNTAESTLTFEQKEV